IPAAACNKDADCCQGVPLVGRAFCYCQLPPPLCETCSQPPGHGEGTSLPSAGVCKMRRVCFGDLPTCARGPESADIIGTIFVAPGSPDAARLHFDRASVTYVLGRGPADTQSGALEFHRLAEYTAAFFSSGSLPASIDSNEDLDCEGAADPAP